MKALKRITIILAVAGLIMAIKTADNREATGSEIASAAIMGLISVSSILTITLTKDHGTRTNEN